MHAECHSLAQLLTCNYSLCLCLIYLCVLLSTKQVGDSLAHDIVGASSAGIDSVFIAGGICGEELGVDAKAEQSTFHLSPEALEKVFARENVTPTWTMPLFAL